MIATIHARAKAAGVEPLEYVCGRLEEGELAKTIGEELGGSYTTLKRWVNKQPGGKARWDEAIAERAHVAIEETIEIADELAKTEASKEDIAAGKMRIETRQFMARAHNRKVYGNDAAQVNVNVSMGDLHIDALRHRQALRARSQPQLEAVEADYEVLPAAREG